ncbi:hypothetical protein AB0A63_24510 [Lentzea sp. NPDC042327]|uniref:hypothetical protein n=1 Tax=Lentzea sp. NPDC042327 TaxID=3154801 RepID=UPI0033E763B1
MAVLTESSLHKKLGLRGQGIAHVRQTTLGASLHIDPDDDDFVVLVKLHWHVGRAIDALPYDTVAREVLRYACNIPRDAEMNPLNCRDRLLLLEQRKRGQQQRGWARNTHQTKLAERVKEIWAQLQRTPKPPMPEELVESEVRAERLYAKSGVAGIRIEVPADIVDDLLWDANTAAVKGIERLLPRMELFFEVGSSGCLVTVRTERHEQLPVFTSRERFEEFTDPSRRWGREPGRVLLELLEPYPEVGLSLNPILGGHRHLHWTGQDVARLRNEMRNKEA